MKREKSCRSESETKRKNKCHSGNKNCDDVKSDKKGKGVAITSKQTEELSQCKMSIPPDLVLGAAGMSDPHSLIIKVKKIVFLKKKKKKNAFFNFKNKFCITGLILQTIIFAGFNAIS